MNRQRLEHLIKVLEAVPPAKFDMDVFGRTTQAGVKPGVKCVAAACALGWASLDEEFQRQGLAPRMGNAINGWAPVYTEVTGMRSYFGFFAGEEFFGLSPRQGYFLFDPGTYAEDFGRPQNEDEFEPEDPDEHWNAFFSEIKPEHVIERVRQLLGEAQDQSND